MWYRLPILLVAGLLLLVANIESNKQLAGAGLVIIGTWVTLEIMDNIRKN